MLTLGKEWNIKTDHIKYYCDNRDLCLSKVSSIRNVSKIAFLKIAYGGVIELIDNDFNDDGIAPDGDITLLRKIEEEVREMMDYCFLNFKQYHKLVEKKSNKKASLFALVLQTEECKCLMALDKYLTENGRFVDILIHDGLEVRKKENEFAFPTELLRGGENAILEKTGYRVKLVEKPIEHEYVIKTNNILYNDAFAAETFVKLMGDNIKFDGNNIFFYNDSIGMWEHTTKAFKQNLLKFKNKLTFHNPVTKKTIDYFGNENNVMNMRKWLTVFIDDDDFFNTNVNSSMGKLLFSDGIYDFKTNSFKEGFDRNIIFLKRIKRKYPKDVDEAKIAEVNHILFVSAFDNDGGIQGGEYLKKALTMAIYGDYFRKKFYICTGSANCGKGLLVGAMTECFEGFIEEYDANNFLYNSKCSTDEAKRLAWLYQLNGARVGFSNEIRITNGKNDGMDGNLMKSSASGGDKMKIRENFENQKTYVNKCIMFMLCNDIPQIFPVDSGILTRVSFLKYTLSFVDNPSEPNHRKADNSVKQKFLNDDYKNALFHLIVRTYVSMENTEKQLGGCIIEPQCVINETKESIVDDKVKFLEKLNEFFEITNNPDDKVETKIIIEKILGNGDIKLSSIAIGKKLNSLNLENTSDGSTRYRKGIKLRKNSIKNDYS